MHPLLQNMVVMLQHCIDSSPDRTTAFPVRISVTKPVQVLVSHTQISCMSWVSVNHKMGSSCFSCFWISYAAKAYSSSFVRLRMAVQNFVENKGNYYKILKSIGCWNRRMSNGQKPRGPLYMCFQSRICRNFSMALILIRPSEHVAVYDILQQFLVFLCFVFADKYDYVGRLLKPGEEPNNYSDEEEEGSQQESAEKSKDEWNLEITTSVTREEGRGFAMYDFLIWQQLLVPTSLLKLYRNGLLAISYFGISPGLAVVLWCHFFLSGDYSYYADICYQLCKAGGRVTYGNFLSVHTMMMTQFCIHLKFPARTLLILI